MKKHSYKELEEEIKRLKKKQKEIEKVNIEKEKLHDELRERVKELHGLYKLSKLADENVTLEKIFKETVNIIVESLEDPENSCARLIFGDKEFTTDNFTKTELKQSADIKVNKRKSGTIEAYYLKKYGDIYGHQFSKDERLLIKVIGEQLGKIIEQRIAEEFLEENEELCQVFEEHIHDIIYYRLQAHPTFKYNFVSLSTTPITGYTPEEHYADPHLGFKIVHPEDRHLLHSILNPPESVRSPKILRWIRKDGKIIWIELRYTPVYDNKGNILFLEGIAHDITDCRKMCMSLTECNGEFRTLLLNTNDIVYSIDDKGVINFISPQVENYGLKQEDIISKNFQEFIFHDDRDRVFHDFHKSIETGEEFLTQFRIKDKPGNIHWFEDKGKIQYDETGKNIGIVGILRDITERKIMEEKLRESEEWFRNLSDQSPNIIFVYNLKANRIVYVNNQGEKITGYTREELYSPDFNFLVLIAPEYKDLIIENINRHHRGEELESYQFSIITRDGKRINSIGSTKLVHYNGNLSLLGIVTDITSLIAAEEALRRSEASLAHAQQIAHMGSWEWNIEKNEVKWSDEKFRIFGFKPQEFEVTYEKFISCVHPGDREFVKKSVNEAIYEKAPYNFEFRIIRPDDAERIINAQGEVIFDGAGSAIHMFGTVLDITERKNAEKKLILTQKELEIKAKNLEETNTALKVLLKHQDEEKQTIENNMLTNIETLVLPYLEKIKNGTSDERQKTFVNIIETNLSEITKFFASKLADYHTKLTPAEIQIANLIKENKSTGEIANILCIAEATVFSHRRHIRDKLGLKSKSTNLQSFLQSILRK